jgi:O-antigen/teichoic acid export membrane protein
LKFISNLFITFWTSLVGVILTFAIGIIVARTLGPDGKGAYSLIVLVPSVLSMLGNLGIGIANAYFSGKKKYELSHIASNSLILGLVLGIIITAAFLIYYFVFQPAFLRDAQPKEALILAISVLPLMLLTTYFNNMLLGLGKIKEFNLVNLVHYLAYILLVLLFLFVISLNVFNLFIAWTSATLITCILSIFLITRITKIRLSFHPAVFKESLKYGGQGYAGNLLQFLNYRFDIFIVAFFLSTAFVGYYSVAVSLAETLWYLPGAVGTVIFAKTIGVSTDKSNKSTPIICRNTIAFTLVAAILLFALGKYIIILLFGSSFLPALEALNILLPGMVAFSICKVLGNEILGRGKPLINTINVAISLAISIPLDFILIPKIGIAGAALASTISYIASAIFSLIVFVKISSVRWVDVLIPKVDDFKYYKQLFTRFRHMGSSRK